MNKYTILEANAKTDKENIYPVLERNLNLMTPQRYEWNYNSCPYGNARCWIVEHQKSSSIIGSSALFPRKMLNNGESFYAAIAGDFAVDKKYRAYGPALKIIKEIKSKLKDSKFKFIYGVPNELSRTLFLKLGYAEIGDFDRYVKILKTEYKSNKYISKCLRIKLLSGLAEIFIKTFSREKRYKKTHDYSIETPDSFDERFDLFWKKVSKQYNIIGERTSNFLNWRYKQSSMHKYKIFCISENNKDITGYIVHYFEENMCHIVDMLYKKSEKIIESLLAEFALYIRRKGIGSISVYYIGDVLLRDKLKEFNFHIVKKEDKIIIIYCPNLSSESYLLDKKNWHFFEGDNDI